MDDIKEIICTSNSRSRFDDVPLAELPLAMAYVPMQKLDSVYSEEAALCTGTLFPSLDKPFLGKRWGK